MDTSIAERFSVVVDRVAGIVAESAKIVGL